MRVGIIGAGIAGLTLATRLVEGGHSAQLFDKGRGVGGRASTHRGDGVAFDHGAQYYTARDPSFRAFLDAHVPATDRAEWRARFATLEAGGRLVAEPASDPRYVGVPGMSTLAKALARGLDVRTEVRVAGLSGSSGAWSLVDPEGVEHGPFDWVVSTAPPVQSSALLDRSTSIVGELARVVMQPSFTLMLAPINGASLPFDGIRCRHPILGWAANDHSKPGRGPKPALVIQSDHAWASTHREEGHPAIAEALANAASEAFGVDLGPLDSASVHRWLYAKPAEALGKPCLIDHEARLAACGDWCVAARIEGAFQSGDACARELMT